MGELRRLPEFSESGTWKTTRNADVYAKAWTELGEQIAAFFPGYIADAFDPDFRFTKWEKNRFDQNIAVDKFHMSVSACRLLLKTAQLKKKGKK